MNRHPRHIDVWKVKASPCCPIPKMLLHKSLKKLNAGSHRKASEHSTSQLDAYGAIYQEDTRGCRGNGANDSINECNLIFTWNHAEISSLLSVYSDTRPE